MAPAPLPAPTPLPASAVASSGPRPNQVNDYLRQLSSADEQARAGAMVQLGRMKAQQAAEPIGQALAGDRSPVAREAAARALGLIGSPASLPALQRAAQADDDREVRHSAQFAAEVIRANLPR
jgi:HEAT repeat protein